MNTMLKRIVSMFLCFVLVAGYLPAGAIAAENEETVAAEVTEAATEPSVVENAEETAETTEEKKPEKPEKSGKHEKPGKPEKENKPGKHEQETTPVTEVTVPVTEETVPATEETVPETTGETVPAVIAVTGITLDQTLLEVGVGELPMSLTATVQPEDATDKTVTWTSSEPGVASVDENGTLTFGYMGEATITVTAGEFSASCVVTVGEGEWDTYEGGKVVIAASDYQRSDSGTIMTNIMNHIKDDYGSAYGALLGGDYDAGSVSTKASHIQAVDDTISGVFSEIDGNNRVYIQGNHENYAGLKPSSSNLLTTEHVRDTEYYGVYAINHDDFPWTTSSNPSPSESLVQGTADDLGDYLDAKIAAGYTKPIFVMSHLPLHATTRGDNRYASLIFDKLEAAGEAGLNIIFLVGHNHSGGYDQYLGNGSFYLPVGSSLTVVKGTSGTYTDNNISFTYMNYGYLGKISGSACTHQTMTAFEITDDQVTVKRYAADGLHKLKAAGVTVSGYNTDTSVIDTEGAVIELGEAEPVETFADGGVSVSAPGLTGLSVTKTQSTADGKHDAETYCAYASYDIVPMGYEQGKSATVTITLDEEDGFDASKAVYLIDAENGTEKKLAIAQGTVTFTTNHFSTYSIVQKVIKTGSYELATSIEAGESYVIIANDYPVALMDHEGTLDSQEVVISGDILTSEEELTQWTFSSATSGTITSSNGNKLGYSSSCWNLSGNGDCSFEIDSGSGNFSLRVIRASSGYNRYYFNYDGNDWSSKPTSAAYVRLYQLVEGGSTVEPEEPETPAEPENPEIPEEGQWIALPAGNTYELDTDGIDSGAKYLIVAKNYEKALTAASASGNASDISIDGETATADAGYGWTITASGSAYTIQNNSTYLNRSNTSLAAGNSGSTWTVSNSGSGNYTITQAGTGNSWWGNSSSYYVRWSNSNNYFQASNYNTDPVRLYKYTGAGIGANYIRLSGETEQTYTVADAAALNTVLGKVMIQTSDDGTTVNKETLSVTNDMVSWNPAFDGKTAGTYMGTVVYGDNTLGTITVTVNAEHDFETITVEATCTTDGVVTKRCTICGEETVEVIEAKGHDYDCVITDATCGAEGSKSYTCNICGDNYTESISATENHTYKSVVVDATCTETGSITHTCTVCGNSYMEVLAAVGHAYSNVVTVPTCTTAGYITYTCETCGHSYTDGATAALGHDYESVITATCTEDGCVVYTCKNCDHSYNGETVKAYGHNYESTTVEPGCATAGYTTYVCAVCGHTYTGDEVAARGHTFETETVEATCTENGYTTYTCKICSHSYVADEVLALGHDYESVVTAPTFETEGYTTHSCKICGDVKVDSYVPVLRHEYESVTVEVTCTENGYTTYTCVNCGYTYTDIILAPGHAFTTVTTDATCTENGSVVSTCATCGYVESEVISATGHSYETIVMNPTCETVGYTTYTCACGHVVTEEIPALGHSYESRYAVPTCTETGGTTYTCTVCADTYTEVEAALGHSYTTESVAPTCQEKGHTTYTCVTCGDSYIADEVAALGHDYVASVTAPTCTEGGYTTYTCKACGDSYVSNQTAALGHSYTTEESNGYMIYTCTICGDSYSEKIQTVSYTKVSSISNNNSYVITLYSGSKYYALSHENNKISIVQVTVSDGVITSEITEDLIWNYSGKKLSYADGNTTYYMYAQSAGGWWGWWSTPTLTLSTSSSSTVSFSNSKLKVGNHYLHYSNNAASLNYSATTTYCFAEK